MLRGPALHLSDGRRIRLDALVVIGRDPSPPAGDQQSVIVAVGGDRMVSKTHLALGVDSDGVVWIEDRHSTNGVVVTRHGRDHTMTSGARFDLATGDRVQFGQQWADVVE